MSRSQQHELSFRHQRAEGIAAFNQARRQAFLSNVFNHLRGKPAELLSYEEIRARLHLHEETYRGIQIIPLDQIAGSMGRYHEFTRSFLPKHETMRERWARVYAATISMAGVPPIEVYQVGCVYFVRDGNHRVSVARRLGATTIEAHVIELTSPICLSADVSPQDIDAAESYAVFLEESGLRYLRSDYLPFELSEPSRYDDLMGHIRLHRTVLGADQSLENAAADWWETVFCPLMTPIHDYGVLDCFRGRTKADLYLWAIDHLHDLEGECCAEQPVTPRRLHHALTAFLAQRDITLPDQAWDGVPLSDDPGAE
jgi:hypothetical protein